MLAATSQSPTPVFLPAWPERALIGWADPLEPRVAIGAVHTDLLADPLALRSRSIPGAPARELQGVVSLAATLGLVGSKGGGVTLGITGGVTSRFRLEQDDNDALSSDYLIAFPIVLARGGFTARVRPLHRSGHIGDELVEKSGVRRLEFDHEEIDFLGTIRLGPFRPYAGGFVTLASSYAQDDGGLRAGVDAEHHLGLGTALVGGLDWQRTGISGWENRVAAAAGLEFQRGDRRLTLMLRHSSGATVVGELFADRERYWGFELILRP